MIWNTQKWYFLMIACLAVPGCLCIVGDPAKKPQPSYAIVKFSDWLQCGGVLVSRDLVATTASCVVRPFGTSRLFSVTLGATNRTKAEAKQQHFGVIDIIVHPDYVKNIVLDGSSDLALLRLSRNATIVPDRVEVVGKISSSLEEDGDWDNGRVKCSINGYGLTYYGDTGRYSDVRRAINVVGSTTSECRDFIYPITFKMAVNKQTCSLAEWSTTCVGDEGSPLLCPDYGGTDVGLVQYSTCRKGDEGSPLLCPDGDGTDVLIGLVQYSTCRRASVIMYTRLSHYATWIQQHF